jgi:cytochrome c
MSSADRRLRTIESGLQGENMKAVAVFLGIAAVALAAPSQAQEALAKKYNCFACHAVDKKLVGPSYKDVAAKYAKDPNAEAKLAEKVKKGGSGVWGQVPMPPNSQVPDADVHSLVKWVLSQK